MLKHKIRKSRKNILSLLESVHQEEENRKENIPTYSEIKKREKKGKDRNVKIGKYFSLNSMSVLDEVTYI